MQHVGASFSARVKIDPFGFDGSAEVAVEEMTDVIATRPLGKKRRQQPCVSTALGTKMLEQSAR